MSLVSDGSFWTISPIEMPDVEAHINLDYRIGNQNLEAFMETETTRFSKLIIPMYCSLFLYCKYNTPVVWLKDGEPILNTTDMFDYYRRLDSTSIPSNDAAPDMYKLPIYRRFKGWVRIKNVTLDTAGSYTCSMRIPNANTTADVLQSTIELTVQAPAPTEASNDPAILLSWFDKTHYKFNFNYSFDFIWIAPTGGASKQYFVFPDNRKVDIGEAVNGIEAGSDVIFNNTRLVAWKARLRMITKFEHAGKYTFVIEYEAANGSRTKLVRPLNLIPFKYLYNLAERPLTEEFRTYLMVGRHYKLTFWTSYVEPIIEAEMETFSQSFASRDCGFTPVRARDVYEECGVISVIKKVLLRSARVNAVDINLRAVKSCSFRIRIWSPGQVIQTATTYINVTSIQESFSDREFSDKEAERTIVVSLPGGKRQGTDRYVNESVTLRCLVPACDWELIGWCKQKTTKRCAWLLWKSDKIRFEGSVADDPSIKASFEHLNNFTVAFDITIDQLQLNQSGEYGCGTYKPVHKPRKLGDTFRKWLDYPEYQFSLPFVNFHLNVLEPRKPYFSGNQSEIQELFIKRGGTTDLSCPVKGSPNPLIMWKRRSESSDSDTSAELDERSGNIMWATNMTTMAIRETGTYECLARNRFGENVRKFRVAYDSGVSPLPIVLSVLGAAMLFSFAVGVPIWLRRRANAAIFKELARMLKEPPEGISLDIDSPLNDQTDILPYNINYEIDRDRFKLVKIIGDGEFGQVYRGELCVGENEFRHVAVKTPKDPLNKQQHKSLIAELKIMVYLRPHVNVLSLVGACTSGLEKNQLFVLTEYCEKGSLLSYLQDHLLDYEAITHRLDGQSSEYSVQSLLEYAYQAGNGMEYLAARTIVHRDLALRNLLLTRRGVIKISDFGLSRQKETVYSYNKFMSQNVRLPIAWMAPESIINYEYTHKADVWSFGIVLWEIFSCGRMPYSSVDINMSEIIHFVRKGNRLPKPKMSTVEMYGLMHDCWNLTPTARPTFSECKSRIARHLEANFPSNYTSLLLLLSDAFCQMKTDGSAQSEDAEEPQPANDENAPDLEIKFDIDINEYGDEFSNATPAAYDKWDSEHFNETPDEAVSHPASGYIGNYDSPASDGDC